MERECTWLLHEKHDGVESPAFLSDLKRLENGEPLAYVIGWIPFLHTKIYLDSRPLIPRTETEFWTQYAIQEIKQRNQKEIRILDLCAGSGCIGVAVLKNIPASHVDFVEINKDHHATIKKNILENGAEENRSHIFGGSLFENVTEKYDFIVTNPPYVDPKLSARVQESVIDHEPSLALFGGENGMELVEKILREAKNFLKSDGILYIEHEPEQELLIKKLLPGIQSYKDQFGLVRFSVYKN